MLNCVDERRLIAILYYTVVGDKTTRDIRVTVYNIRYNNLQSNYIVLKVNDEGKNLLSISL